MSDRENPQEAWLERVRKEYAATPPPQGARKRIEEALQSEPPPGARPRPLSSVRAKPWLIAAGAAVVLGGALWAVSANRDQRKSPIVATPLVSAESTAVVRFVLSAPGASTVSVVGDFNGWDTTAAPMRETNAGLWTVSLPVSHGRHVYAFVVNRSRWISDPEAPLSPEDGFGVSSSVLVVGGGT